MLAEHRAQRGLRELLVASRKFATWMMALRGSTTRKYTTAFTFTETLSRVMMSCGGTSRPPCAGRRARTAGCRE